MKECSTCKNNWMNRRTIEVEEIEKCTEDCRSCQRHGKVLYVPVDTGDSTSTVPSNG